MNAQYSTLTVEPTNHAFLQFSIGSCDFNASRPIKCAGSATTHSRGTNLLTLQEST